MTDCIRLKRGTSKLLERVPNPFDDINKICSKQKQKTSVFLCVVKNRLSKITLTWPV